MDEETTQPAEAAADEPQVEAGPADAPEEGSEDEPTDDAGDPHEPPADAPEGDV